MHYDTVMCMMVEDKVKTKDTVPNGWRVTVEQNLKKYYVYSKALSESGAKLEAIKEYPNATVLNVERCNVKDSDKKTIDKAIRTCDSMYSDLKEVYNILAEALRNSSNSDKMVQLVSKAQGKILELAAKSR